jgi:hypothetical protein
MSFEAKRAIPYLWDSVCRDMKMTVAFAARHQTRCPTGFATRFRGVEYFEKGSDPDEGY